MFQEVASINDMQYKYNVLLSPIFVTIISLNTVSSKYDQV